MSLYVVTGANRGIGLEMCRQLKQRGDEVIAVCRRNSSELEELGIRVETGVDVAHGDSVSLFAERLKDIDIDVLVNNAGILQRISFDELDFDSVRRQFEVNALGPLRVTHALRNRLRHGSKIAILTSLMGSLADNTSGGHYGYRMSKAAVSMAGVSLAHDLRPRGIAVAILHPGMVSTDMTGHRGISVGKSVRGMLDRIAGLNLDNSGTFWHSDGRVLPW